MYLLMTLTSRQYVQSQQQRHQNDLFKHNVSIVIFEQVNAGWLVQESNHDVQSFHNAQAFSEPSQTSKMELFATIING